MATRTPRHFTPPWTVIRTEGSHYMVQDANGLPLAYVYVRNPRSTFDGLSDDEARRIAANIAKLPELLRRETGET